MVGRMAVLGVHPASRNRRQIMRSASVRFIRSSVSLPVRPTTMRKGGEGLSSSVPPPAPRPKRAAELRYLSVT